MARRQSPSSIVKGDRVRVIRGNFRDMEGSVLRVLPAKGRVVVEGVNMRKRHEISVRCGLPVVDFDYPNPDYR